jgi:hypothetical protein
VENPEEMRPLRKARYRWVDKLKMDLGEITRAWELTGLIWPWIATRQYSNEPSNSIKCWVTAHLMTSRGVIISIYVRFEVFTAVTMKNGVFWVVTPCGSCNLDGYEVRGPVKAQSMQRLAANRLDELLTAHAVVRLVSSRLEEP